MLMYAKATHDATRATPLIYVGIFQTCTAIQYWRGGKTV